MRKGIIYISVVFLLAGIFALSITFTSSGNGASANRSASDDGIGSSPPPNVDDGWDLAFNGTFSGSQINASVWATCYTWATKAGCTNYGNSDEDEWYLPSQVRISGDALDLVSQRTPTLGLSSKGAPKEYYCRSGMVTTYPSFRFQYGYIQVTARVPFGPELWSAFWLAAANKKWPPEVDILEHWGTSTKSSVYLHPVQNASFHGSMNTPDISVGWHTFGLYWTRTSLTWYLDGQEVFTTAADIPQQPMYFIADLAGYIPPGSHAKLPAANGCSGSLLISSVKVWEKK